MMKKLCFFCLFAWSLNGAYGQGIAADSTSLWKMKLSLGINVNQAAFSSNWKAGGVSSIGLNAQLNGIAKYKKGVHSWDNELDALYGFIYREDPGYEKTLDRLYLDSKYGYALDDKWSLFASVNFLTQFAEGFDNETPKRLVSEIIAPAYITFAVGAMYEPVDYFNVRIAPLAPRLTLVENPLRFRESVSETPYGVSIPSDSSSKLASRFEGLALNLQANFDKDLTENLNLKFRYVLFANYETLSLDKWDHRIDVNLVAKIGKYINTSLGAILLYDYDQDKSVQLSQLFTLGVAYTIKNFEEKKE